MKVALFKSDSFLAEVEFVRNETLTHLLSKNFVSFDPFDGLNSPVGDFLCDKHRINNGLYRFIRLAILQLVKRSPIDLRPFIGVRPQQNAMTIACVLLGLTNGTRNLETELQCVNLLLELRDKKTGLWGYPFPWQARAFYVATNEPNIVISSLCLRAISYWIKNSQDVERSISAECFSVLDQGQKSIFDLFYRTSDQAIKGYFSYVVNESVLVHNANLFGIESCLTIECLKHRLQPDLPLNRKLIDSCLGALDQTIRAQELSGRWSYGTKSFHQWADNFHSVYNLISLDRINEAINDLRIDGTVSEKIKNSIQKGAKYYLDHAIDSSGIAHYYDNKCNPIETHSYATFFLFFGSRYYKKIPIEELLAKDTFARAWKSFRNLMEVKPGHFRYRASRWQTMFGIRQPSNLRWVEAWIFYGLSFINSSSLSNSKTYTISGES